MKVTNAEWGWGMGTREEGVLFIFHTREVMEQFLAGKWQWAAGAEVTAKPGGTGVGGDTGTRSNATLTAYTLTNAGISYGITIRGRKFSRDHHLDGGADDVTPADSEAPSKS